MDNHRAACEGEENGGGLVMHISEARLAADRYELGQNGLAAILVSLDPPSSGIVIVGRMADGFNAEIKGTGSRVIAVALPFSGFEISLQTLPGLKEYSSTKSSVRLN
jgi:hypothetical protein